MSNETSETTEKKAPPSTAATTAKIVKMIESLPEDQRPKVVEAIMALYA